MSTTSLTDRYIWAVTRQLSAETGPDVARELRSTLLEAVEDRVGGGEDPREAERAALLELGDPDVLARDYGGKPQHLVGPAIYADYLRLLKVLLIVVLPIIVIVSLLDQAFGGEESWGALVGQTAWGVIETGVHITFWTTLVFVLIERGRSESERNQPLSSWQPDQLMTADVPWRKPGFGEMVGEVVFSVALALLVAWQFFEVGDSGIQILDPDLALGWKVAIIGLFIVDAVVAVLAWRLGRWTWGLAAVNTLANVASGTILVWLLFADRLLVDIPQELGEQFGSDVEWTLSYPVAATIIIVICAWDAISSLLRAHRAGRARTLEPAGQ